MFGFHGHKSIPAPAAPDALMGGNPFTGLQHIRTRESDELLDLDGDWDMEDDNVMNDTIVLHLSDDCDARSFDGNFSAAGCFDGAQNSSVGADLESAAGSFVGVVFDSAAGAGTCNGAAGSFDSSLRSFDCSMDSFDCSMGTSSVLGTVGQVPWTYPLIPPVSGSLVHNFSDAQSSVVAYEQAPAARHVLSYSSVIRGGPPQKRKRGRPKKQPEQQLK